MKSLIIILFYSFYCCKSSMIYKTLRPVQSASLSSIRNHILRNLDTRLFSTIPDSVNSDSPKESPLFSFGVIADIQYVDAPDAMNFQNTTMRRYRQSFNTFKDAITSWDALPTPPKCAIVLGDILDGKSASMQNQEKCINDVLEASKDVDYEMLYCFGNHCHYSFNRNDLHSKLSPHFLKSAGEESSLSESEESSSLGSLGESLGGNCSPSKLYYDWSPYKDWRFISLDCYDVSLIGSSSVENKKIAEELLAKNNPNDLTIGSGWFNGLTYNMRRWVPYNGGISKEQILWLKNVLLKSEELNEKVVIFCHQPVFAPNKPQSLVWNAEEVLEVIREHGNVVIWIAGHDHGGQYSIDLTGIHHLVPPAPLECEEGQQAFGHIEVHLDNLKLNWTGKEPRDALTPWEDTKKMSFIKK